MRRPAAILAMVAVFASGCTSAVGGHPRTAASSSTSSSSEVPADQRDEALAARLESMPSGAVPWQNSWGSTTFPTVEDYLRRMTDSQHARDDIRADLETNGLVDLVHRGWTATDADEIDIVLMRFKDETGAEGRFLTDRDVFRASDTALLLRAPGFSADTLVAYLSSQRTPNQFVLVHVVAHRGDTAMEVFYWSPGELRRDDLDRWVAAQLLLLQKR